MSHRVGRMSRGKNCGPFRFRDTISPSPPQPLDPKIARLRAARLARDADRSKSVPSNSHHRVFGLADELPFGKHKGDTVEFVIDTDISYVTWLMESTDLELTQEAEIEYQARLDPRRPHPHTRRK